MRILALLAFAWISLFAQGNQGETRGKDKDPESNKAKIQEKNIEPRRT